jgi:predicted O-methyltransferase YrrM
MRNAPDVVIAPDTLAQLMAYHCFHEPEAELAAVIETFAATRASAFLEIGTHKGFTSACISLAFPQARVVSVDLPDPTRTPWNPLPRSLVGEAHRALGLEHRIEQRFVDSAELWRFVGRGESFDLVFVDGDHSPQAVFRDLVLAADLVPRNGGVVLAHDFTDTHEAFRPIWTVGVQQAVDQFLEIRPFRKRRLPGLLVALEAA